MRSDAAAPGADTRLVMFEGSSAGKKIVGRGPAHGQEHHPEVATDKLDDYIYYLYSKYGFVYCHFEARSQSRIKYLLVLIETI